MTAITELRGTAWCVHLDQGCYLDPEGHSWFTLKVAREIAQRIDGLPVRSTTRSRKTVVTGYREEGNG